jgi:hypothetical protein
MKGPSDACESRTEACLRCSDRTSALDGIRCRPPFFARTSGALRWGASVFRSESESAVDFHVELVTADLSADGYLG